MLLLTVLFSFQTLMPSNPGLQRAQLAKALLVTAGTAATGIGAYLLNKVGEKRYKDAYGQIYTNTYPNQNNRFLRSARNILTVLSGADKVNDTAKEGDKPPRLYRFFSSIPGWNSLAQKTGIRNIAPEVVTLDTSKFGQTSEHPIYAIIENTLKVTDKKGTIYALNINTNNNVTSTIYGETNPVYFKAINIPSASSSSSSSSSQYDQPKKPYVTRNRGA